jgi:hypothetical protein
MRVLVARETRTSGYSVLRPRLENDVERRLHRFGASRPRERGNFSSAEWAHPKIEYVQADRPEPGTWCGLAGMAEAARAYLDESRAGGRPLPALLLPPTLGAKRQSGLSICSTRQTSCGG